MAYSAETDVEAILQRTIGASTTPNTTQVAGWIADADAEINAILRNHGFTPPVTDADGFLKSISALGASYRTYQAAYAGEGFNQTDRGRELYDEWRAKVKTLKDSPNLIQNTAGDTIPDVSGRPNLIDDVAAATSPRFTMEDQF